MAKVRLSQGAKHIGNRYTSLGGIGIGMGMDLIGRVAGGEKLSLGTIGKSALTGLAYEMIAPGAQIAMGAVSGLVGLGTAAYASVRNQEQKWKERRQTGLRSTYTDSQQALTMRQAAVQAIQGSRMNARNALGGEAAMMHRGWYR